MNTKIHEQLPDVVEVQAQILNLDLALYTHTLQLHICGVPRASNDQLHICRYPALHLMTGTQYTSPPPVKQGVELKMHGIHLVYEEGVVILKEELFTKMIRKSYWPTTLLQQKASRNTKIEIITIHKQLTLQRRLYILTTLDLSSGMTPWETKNTISDLMLVIGTATSAGITIVTLATIAEAM
ncbi:hypothetical protein YC2023_101507 [Brassica napus]